MYHLWSPPSYMSAIFKDGGLRYRAGPGRLVHSAAGKCSDEWGGKAG